MGDCNIINMTFGSTTRMRVRAFPQARSASAPLSPDYLYFAWSEVKKVQAFFRGERPPPVEARCRRWRKRRELRAKGKKE